MPTPPEEKNHRQPAPCIGARRLLMVAVSASMLLVLAIAADRLLRAAHQDDGGASAWMKVMTLSAPALWTAGSPMRHPETLHPGVDLRFSAGLVAAP